MSQRSISRSERRMGKRQAVMLLILVLAISLISFSLGVMVGRSGTKQLARTENRAIPPRPEAAPSEIRPPQTPAPPAQNEPTTDDTGSAGVEATEKSEGKMTFYETLPRGDLPLGSGINLPPASVAEETASAASNKKPRESSAVAASQPAAGSAVKVAVPAPEAGPNGRYVVQIASFKDAGGANQLKQRLDDKGYGLFIETADLGGKGIWYRVYAGPYPDRSSADQAADRLKRQEKMAPLVRKR